MTDHDAPWLGKGVHYRMHPGNVDVLSMAKIDWLRDTLTGIGRPLGTRIDDAGEGRLVVSW